MRIEVTGDKETAQSIMRVGLRAAHPQQALTSAGDYLYHETARRFSTEGRYGPGRWKRLQPETVRKKRSKGQDTRTLHRTGALADALTHRGGGNQIYRVDNRGLKLGTTLFYAHMHDAAKKGSHLPRRRPMTFSRAARADVVTLLERWITEGKSGLREGRL